MMGQLEKRTQFITDTLAMVQRMVDHCAELPTPGEPLFAVKAVGEAPRYFVQQEPLDAVSRTIPARDGTLRNRQRLLQIEREASYQLALHRVQVLAGRWS